MITRYDYASRAIVGARDQQEDQCAFAAGGNLDAGRDTDSATPTAGQDAERQRLLAVLADGMGGHVAGQRASQLACDVFVKDFDIGASGAEISPGNRLHRALMAANGAIAEAVQDDPSLSGMGCTLIAVSFNGRGMRWVSVGDSLVYLFRGGTLSRMNADHSMAGVLDDLARRGLMDPIEAQESPRRHLLRSAVTGRRIEEIELKSDLVALQPGDVVLLASDGIETLGREEAGAVVGDRRGEGAAAICDALIGAVQSHCEPYQDNTTVMAVAPCFDDTGPDDGGGGLERDDSPTVRLGRHMR